jgi:hypothetical protein
MPHNGDDDDRRGVSEDTGTFVPEQKSSEFGGDLCKRSVIVLIIQQENHTLAQPSLMAFLMSAGERLAT